MKIFLYIWDLFLLSGCVNYKGDSFVKGERIKVYNSKSKKNLTK